MAVQSIGVIGVGKLGSDVALSLAERDLSDIVLYDKDPDRAKLVAEDLRDTAFGHVYNSAISAADDLSDLVDCDVILVAAGTSTDASMSQAESYAKNATMIDEIASAFVGSSTLFVVAGEPIDLLTTRLRRRLRVPASRVLGLGGVVDSFRLRHQIATQLELNPDYVTAHVVGPHGPGVQIVWEFTSANGLPITEIVDSEMLAKIEERFAKERSLRPGQLSAGTSRYAPAMAAVELVRSVVKDDRRVISVTTEWDGEFGISGVAMSAPAVIGRFGADRTILPDLSQDVVKNLTEAAAELAGIASDGEA